jgi:predicted dehydrogenase
VQKTVLTLSHNSLVIGLGSAGKRHLETLEKLGSKVSAISRRENLEAFERLIAQRSEALDYELIVVSTETSLHEAILEGVFATDYRGTVLLEKPGMAPVVREELGPRVLVAYNLRYLGALGHLKSILDKGLKPLRITISSLSHLPSWRPKDDRPDQYSRKAGLGGGALLDLSHELDYSRWLFGDWLNFRAFGGKAGNVTIDSDDSWNIIGATKSCSQISINLSLNSHYPRRECIVEFQDFSVVVNLLTGIVDFSDRSPFVGNNISETYLTMLSDLMDGDRSQLPTLRDNQDTLRFIDKIRLEGINNQSSQGAKQ